MKKIDDEYKVPWTITRKSSRRSNKMLELKNGSTMHKAQCLRPIKESTNQHEIQVSIGLSTSSYMSVPFPLCKPHQAHQHQIPYIGVMYGI